MSNSLISAAEQLDNLIDGLQLLYENQVTNVLTGLDPKGIKDLSAIYIRMRRLRDVVDALDKLKTAQYSRIEHKLATFMDETELSSYTVAGAGRIGVKTQLFGNIKPEKRDEGFKWLRETGNGALITETVNYQSFGAFLRARVEANEDIPDDIINTFYKTSVSFTKAK